MLLGGGCCELTLAHRMRLRAASTGGCERAVFLGIAEAFEVVPLALAENAGADPIRSLRELQRAIRQGAVTMGVNGYTGRICDMREEEVFELLYLKQKLVSSAVQNTETMLRVGGVFVETPAEKMIRSGGPGSKSAQEQ